MRRRNLKLREFVNPGSKVKCARFSKKLTSEGREFNYDKHQYFVTGDDKNNVRLYQFSDQEELNNFNSSNNTSVQSEVSAVMISWEEDCIYSGSNRGIIHIWDMKQDRTGPITTLKGHATSVNCFGLFPDEPNQIASGSYDTHIKIWDTRKKDCTATLKHHQMQINSIQVSPDGVCLLSGSEDSTAKLWDLRATNKVLFTYNEHKGPVLRALFNPEDCMFASCSTDKTVKYYSCDKRKGSYGTASSTEQVSMPITSIDFSPDGSLVCAAGNQILRICDMRKNGIFVEAIDSSWKGVADILFCERGIKGIAANSDITSVWYCSLEEKVEQYDRREEELKLPKIFKNPSMRRQGQYSSNRQIEQNSRNAERDRDLQEIRNNLDLVMGNINNVTQLRNRQQREKDLEAKREQDRIKDEEKRQRIRIQREKDKQERQQKQRERQRERQKEKEEEERQKLQKIQQLTREREEREKKIREKVQRGLMNNNHMEEREILENDDVLQSSSVMNFSAIMGDAFPKEKIQQMRIIDDMIKQKTKFQSILNPRIKVNQNILHFWKQGKISIALQALEKSQEPVIYDCISAIIRNTSFRIGLTPDVGSIFIKKLIKIMHHKHSTYVRNSMLLLNDIVQIFKEELIKVKTFSPMTRVDLARQQRLAKFDQLIQNLLDLFKTQRLKKYAFADKDPQFKSLHQAAKQLYLNLEQVLQKLAPRRQPEPA